MSAQPKRLWPVAAILAVSMAGQDAFACHTCKQTPCVLAPPAPAFECVTEMVPCTVMKTKTRVDLVPVCTKTITETKIDIEYDEQIHPVCRPVFDTVFQTRCITVCRPVCETTMVCQPHVVCRPVTTTRQVTEYCLQPYTELITVPVKDRCGHAGHAGGCSTCQTVARTCYRRVPVVREVTETCMVTEVQNEMVPVVRWRMVPEQRIEKYPVTAVRMVNETVRVRVPRMVFRCVPKTLVYKTAVLTCEEIPVTVYRPVVKMVPVVSPSPQAVPTPQGVPAASGQVGAASSQPAPGQPQPATAGRGPAERRGGPATPASPA
jgi:YTV